MFATIDKNIIGKAIARVGMLAASALVAGGAVGASLSTADAATIAWARVSSTGQLLASSGISHAKQNSIGRYNLTTTFALSSCAYTGTVNTTSENDVGLGSASILVQEANSDTLFIRTATPSIAGSRSVDDNRPFSVTIFCP